MKSGLENKSEIEEIVFYEKINRAGSEYEIVGWRKGDSIAIFVFYPSLNVNLHTEVSSRADLIELRNRILEIEFVKK